MTDYPFHRDLRSPLTAAQLGPLDPRCHTIQFSEPLRAGELALVAELAAQSPQVTLRRYGWDVLSDLRFLKHFPSQRRFQIDVLELQSLAGLEYLPTDLEYLGIGQTRSKAHSLRVLRNFPQVKELRLDGHTKQIDTISCLVNLEKLALRSITLPDLSLLLPLHQLATLEIKLGGTRDLALLPQIGRLLYLELWMVKGLSKLGPIGETSTLEYLFLQALKQVSQLPSMEKLTSLRRLHLETMKGLSDLTPVLGATALEELIVVDGVRWELPQLAFLGTHPRLERATIGVGTSQGNAAVSEYLSGYGMQLMEAYKPFQLSNGMVTQK